MNVYICENISEASLEIAYVVSANSKDEAKELIQKNLKEHGEDASLELIKVREFNTSSPKAFRLDPANS
ncbi:hypothetical protein [Priestia megaterium]|uniref:hypothetical protein n=1 Tax=Priestia megaterium TaxID=1404 RepID=UPI00221F84F6|nr:hypothetical protein OHU75_14515 [Priestia megaterium]